MNARLFQSRLHVLLISLLWLAISIALNGCSFLKPANEEQHNYLLTAVPSPKSTSVEVKPACIVRVLPVELPDYLKTSDMVVRTGTNEVTLTKFHQWAEPLGAGIRRVLVENLRGIHGIQEVLTDEPSPSYPKFYIISVKILAFEAKAKNGRGSILFSASWEISQGEEQATTLAHGIFRAPPSSWNPGDYGGMVGQLSGAIADLSGILAQAISAQSNGHSAP